jgi:hypothetical protein
MIGQNVSGAALSAASCLIGQNVSGAALSAGLCPVRRRSFVSWLSMSRGRRPHKEQAPNAKKFYYFLTI